MNTMRTRAGFRRVDTSWPQTVQMRRPQRRRDNNPYARKTSRRTDWLAVVLLLAAAMVALTLIYAKTGPA